VGSWTGGNGYELKGKEGGMEGAKSRMGSERNRRVGSG